MTHTIFLIENNVNRKSVVPLLCRQDLTLRLYSSLDEFIRQARPEPPDGVVIFNARSFHSSGARQVRRLQQACSLPLLIIRAASGHATSAAGAVLKPPFTARKLMNAIHKILPVQDAPSFKVGPLEVCRQHPQVRVDGRLIQLTPRTHALLLQLIHFEGKTVSRAQLFKHVWQTDYTGDTRTLDVHIRWLREAIEADPRRPQWLLTERGQGYRLALPVEPESG